MRTGETPSWIKWVRRNGLETPVWLGLEVLRIGGSWLTPLLELLAPFVPEERQAHFSVLLRDPAALQRELEGLPES